jgi:hypothetical protein
MARPIELVLAMATRKQPHAQRLLARQQVPKAVFDPEG